MLSHAFFYSIANSASKNISGERKDTALRNVLITNDTSKEKILFVYSPLIEEVISIYQEIFQNMLLEVRLLGSVPRGEALVGYSDIDFMALIQGKVSEASLQRLNSASEYLPLTYSFVPKADLDAVERANLSAFQRFVLSSDSLNIYGYDCFTQSAQMMESEQLARLVTPNIAPLIQGYTEYLQTLTDTTLLYQISRVIGKDLLKCLRYILIVKKGMYERNVSNIYKNLLHVLPDKKEIICHLYALYMQPITDKQLLLHSLQRSHQELLPLLYTYGLPEANNQ